MEILALGILYTIAFLITGPFTFITTIYYLVTVFIYAASRNRLDVDEKICNYLSSKWHLEEKQEEKIGTSVAIIWVTGLIIAFMLAIVLTVGHFTHGIPIKETYLMVIHTCVSFLAPFLAKTFWVLLPALGAFFTLRGCFDIYYKISTSIKNLEDKNKT